MKTTKKNKYANVPVNVIRKNDGEDPKIALQKFYKILLNYKTSVC